MQAQPCRRRPSRLRRELNVQGAGGAALAGTERADLARIYGKLGIVSRAKLGGQDRAAPPAGRPKHRQPPDAEGAGAGVYRWHRERTAKGMVSAGEVASCVLDARSMELEVRIPLATQRREEEGLPMSHAHGTRRRSLTAFATAALWRPCLRGFV
jgi:hypothetical protein